MYIVRFVTLVFLLCFSVTSMALRGPTDAERKEEAMHEYSYCMFLAKFSGTSSALSYIEERQSGTPLVGNSMKLAHENCVADSLELLRYQDLDEIIAADDGVNLVPVLSPFIVINSGIPRERHLSRPWTRDYLVELAQYFRDATNGKKLRIASLVRSRVDQDRLSGVRRFYHRIKGNIKIRIGKRRSFADCSSNAVCSTHLTGAAVDISTLGLMKKEREILASRLLEDREHGRILVIYEKRGNHFHVFVFPDRILPSVSSVLLVENIILESISGPSVPDVSAEPQAE